MNSQQLIKNLVTNRALLLHNNEHAFEHLQMLRKGYAHLDDEEVKINIELNWSIALTHFNSEYEEAIKNSTRVLNEFKKSKFRGPITRHYIILGRCYANLGEFEKAERNLLIALEKISHKEPEYIDLRTDILHTLTMNEQIAERGPEKSVQYLNEAIELLKEDTTGRKASCLMGLGNVYINADMLPEAMENYLSAAETFEQRFDLANMGNVYCNIGTCHLKMENFDEAERYLERSLELRMKVGSPEHLSISYYNLALVYKEKGKFDQALDILIKCKDILVSTDSKPFIEDTEKQIAEVMALLKSTQAVSP